MRPTVLLLLLGLSLPPGLAAQHLVPSAFPSLESSSGGPATLRSRASILPLEEDEPDAGALVLGGLLGAIGGFYAGGLLGAGIVGDRCGECWVPAFYAAALGSALGVSTGVHLANRRQGSFGKSALVTLALAGAGILALHKTEHGSVLLLVPIAQIAGAIDIERRPRAE